MPVITIPLVHNTVLKLTNIMKLIYYETNHKCIVILSC